GKMLVSGSDDQTIKLWGLPEGNLIKTLTGHSQTVSSIAISPDGKMLVSGSDDQTIKLWALPEGNLIKTLQGNSGQVTSVAISPDGRMLALGTKDQTIKLWGVPEGNLIACLYDPDMTKEGTNAARYRQMGPKTSTLPCGSPIPAGAVCVCDCVAGTMSTSETVCVCNTVTVSAGSPMPAGTICECDTVAVGSYKGPSAVQGYSDGGYWGGGSSGRGSSGGSGSGGGSAGHHYWYPN
ncbi:hypothetical protein, partial [Candidatus Magnetobacterium casensis]|nr:hypothetical protein [Candidatus Magnetobacterium casensis]